MKNISSIVFILLFTALLFQSCSNTDTNNQLYTLEYNNPIIHIDYSDPDVCKVGDMYYMTASSFNCAPGLPLLESNNLVDWKLIGYAIDSQEPDSVFSKPQHGNGVWAPSIRYHNNKFYIFYGDPDFGIYMLTADNFKGPWSKPHLVKSGAGWIDPCPFWDKDGSAWLVHAWAGSRAGVKSTLTLHKMSTDGKQLLDNGTIIFDGHNGHGTVEGPKMYAKNGYYYVFAPAGGVTQGWQLVLRSDNVTGPYEVRKVLQQGKTNINGPHQGAWVDGYDGESWFYHFQDKEAFGRIVHLQPITWKDNWPIIGDDTDNDNIGEPVMSAKLKAKHPRQPINKNEYSDDFNTPKLNLNWQWHANPHPKWGAPTAHLGFLRLNARPFPNATSLWDLPNLFMQKFPTNSFSATTKIDLFLKEPGDKTGLLIMGYDYAYVGIERKNDQNFLTFTKCRAADKKGTEKVLLSIPWDSKTAYFKVEVKPDANCSFYYSKDGNEFTSVNKDFVALPGKWIGAKIGLFCAGTKVTNDNGYVNVDWFNVLIE